MHRATYYSIHVGQLVCVSDPPCCKKRTVCAEAIVVVRFGILLSSADSPKPPDLIRQIYYRRAREKKVEACFLISCHISRKWGPHIKQGWQRSTVNSYMYAGGNGHSVGAPRNNFLCHILLYNLFGSIGAHKNFEWLEVKLGV